MDCFATAEFGYESYREAHGRMNISSFLSCEDVSVGSSLTDVTALCRCARHINPSLVLVQPRKICPDVTEIVLPET